MSINPTSFGPGPTRNVQPGDTPDLNDGLLSRKVTGQQSGSKTVLRGSINYLVNGEVTAATTALAATMHASFVPVESVTATGTATAAVVEPISGVTANQRVAVTIQVIGSGQLLTMNPGDYLKVNGTTGNLTKWVSTDNPQEKYARFLGIEAGLLLKNSDTPFDISLSPGVTPDQSFTGEANDTFVGWVQLVETQGGA